MLRNLLFLTISSIWKFPVSAIDTDPMLIEPPKVAYQDMLEAAADFSSRRFDSGMEKLGFQSEETKMGRFFGTSQYNVASFRGIKYATAKRFEKPVMFEVHKELDILAYKSGPSCPQPTADFYNNADGYNEDCLYLDVYVPFRRTVMVTSEETPVHSRSKRSGGSGSGDGETAYHDEPPPSVEKEADSIRFTASKEEAELVTIWNAEDDLQLCEDLPVIIAFRGDEFTYASSSEIDGRVLARYGSVIVVVVNYRTGVLGFLSSGDGQIKGNFGLYDQKVAIEWVKKYAKDFGGDPNQITLLGFSSGAESVAAQMLNPTNGYLFQRAILQSGVAKHDTMFYNDEEAEILVQKDVLQKLSDLAECGDDQLSCLKDMDTMKLITKAGKLAFMRQDNRTFGPVRDDEYFPSGFSSGQLLSRYDIMIGVVENEGAKWVNGISENTTMTDMIRHTFASNSYFHCAPEPLVDFLNFEYRDTSETNRFKSLQQGYVNFVNDYSYIAPALAFANKASMGGSNIFFYDFQAYISTTGPDRPQFLDGRPIHGEDQSFVFGMPLLFTELYSSSTRNVSANYVRTISNFAYSGHPDDGPTMKPSYLDSWKPYTPTNMEVYVISENMELKQGLFARNAAVWSEAVGYLMSDEICPKVETVEVKCPESIKYRDWENNYLQWRNEDMPRWREEVQRQEEFVTNGPRNCDNIGPGNDL